MKTAVLCLLSAALAVATAIAVYRWHPHRAKRVFVTYSEEYIAKTIGRERDYEQVETLSRPARPLSSDREPNRDNTAEQQFFRPSVPSTSAPQERVYFTQRGLTF